MIRFWIALAYRYNYVMRFASKNMISIRFLIGLTRSFSYDICASRVQKVENQRSIILIQSIFELLKWKKVSDKNKYLLGWEQNVLH